MNRRRFAATMLQGLASAGLIGVIGGPAQGKPVLDEGRQQKDPQPIDNVGYNPVRGGLISFDYSQPAAPSRRGRRFANYSYQEKNFNRLRR